MKFFPHEVFFVDATKKVALDSRWPDLKQAEARAGNMTASFGLASWVESRELPNPPDLTNKTTKK